MNLGQVKTRALALMDEYSVDGTLNSETENADYLNRMAVFASDAQFEIADKVNIDASIVYQLEKQDDSVKYHKLDLPTNYKELKFIYFNDELFEGAYRLVNRQLWISSGYVGVLELFYNKNPQTLDAETEDSYEFEVEEHVQHLIPYYVGGQAFSGEKDEISDKLLNLYYGKLDAVRKEYNDGQQTIDTTFFM
ncbi:hypothetical protein AB3N02_13820 [Priestia aryabhattai]|uniref:hypothetical protein n=1 Tax=Priestia aryabhattai TaxID=412384 RepID=UPI0039A2B0A4